jgi:2-amino-4-hydroxy-6-hydroxymethyldihydropteridine diphosphokinase
MPTVYLALGSNLGDRARNLRRALDALAPDLGVEAVSRCYETEPAYVLDQPRFYNLACRAQTDLTPLALLRRVKALESELGRAPGQRYGPRLVDIDILLFDEVVLHLPELTLPHPRLFERAFVLVPLNEIAAEAVHPVLGLSVGDLCHRLGDTEHLVWLAPECNAALSEPGEAA